MSYTINTLSVTYPVGSICPYGGSTDPSGWIICNNTTRVNTNNIYGGLIGMSIGNGTNLSGQVYQNYTPPDLRKYTMIGTNNSANLKTTVGNNNNEYTITEVPLHNHSTPSTVNHTGINHIHTNVDWSMGEDAAEPYGNSQQPNGGDRYGGDGAIADYLDSKTTSSVTHSHANSTSNSNGTGTPVNILNSCYVINWILKY